MYITTIIVYQGEYTLEEYQMTGKRCGAAELRREEGGGRLGGSCESAMLSADDERRLRPVYDAMDLREYRRALKLINSQIGKQQGQSPSSSRPSYVSQILRALKAVALDKTGKQQEALQVRECFR